MKTPALFLALASLAGSAFAADALDFPKASFRITTGSQTSVNPSVGPGHEIKIDGRTVKAGQVVTAKLTVEWIVAPSTEVGDEYVFHVRRPNTAPTTHAVVFKGAYHLVLKSDDVTIEIINN